MCSIITRISSIYLEDGVNFMGNRWQNQVKSGLADILLILFRYVWTWQTESYTTIDKLLLLATMTIWSRLKLSQTEIITISFYFWQWWWKYSLFSQWKTETTPRLMVIVLQIFQNSYDISMLSKLINYQRDLDKDDHAMLYFLLSEMSTYWSQE